MNICDLILLRIGHVVEVCTCHLADTLVGSSDMVCHIGLPDPQGEVEIQGLNPQAIHSGVAGPLGAQGGGQICRPLILGF